MKPLVFFDPVKHIYTDAKGNRLISCSKLISGLTPPFDPDGKITEKYALKNGLTVEQVKAQWKETNKQSCDYGTAIHNEIEYYIKYREVRESPYSHYVEQFSKQRYNGRLFSERMLYCLNNMVAGTADLIELGQGMVNIDDVKTNKKLEKTSTWGNKMLNEVSHLDDCNFNHYQLQLSIYGYLCELKGLKVNRLRVLYFNPDTKLMEVHIARYMRDEVIDIFKNKNYLKN